MEQQIEISYKKKLIYRILLLILGMFCVSLGTTLIMKANLGQSSVSSFAKNVEYVSGIKSGTILAGINYICFILQIILLKKEFKLIQILQLFLTTLFGTLVNFFSYSFEITAGIASDIYLVKLLILITGLLISTFGVSSMIKADLIFLPFEGFCNTLVDKLKKPFSMVRPIIDMSIVALSIGLIIIFKIPNTTVREGTIICTLLFGKIVGFYNKNIFKC